jgi:hypothetical protein
MKSPKTIRIQTTVGDLVAILCDVTQPLFKKREQALFVAYILNDLLEKPSAGNPRVVGKGR